MDIRRVALKTFAYTSVFLLSLLKTDVQDYDLLDIFKTKEEEQGITYTNYSLKDSIISDVSDKIDRDKPLENLEAIAETLDDYGFEYRDKGSSLSDALEGRELVSDHHDLKNKIVGKNFDLPLPVAFTNDKIIPVSITEDDTVYWAAIGGDENRDKYSLSKAFEDREFMCGHYALMYHAIGENLGLPITAAFAGNHILPVYTTEDDTIYWAATSDYDGKEREKEKLIGIWDLNRESVERGVYLEPLARREVKSIIYQYLDEYDKAVECAPDNPVNTNLASTVTEDDDEKKHYLEKTLSLDPDYLGAYVNLGILHRWDDEDEKAIGFYDEAIKKDSSYSYSFYCKSFVEANKGDTAEALSYIKKALENPEEEDKRKYLEQAASLDQGYLEEYVNIGVGHRWNGDNEKAMEIYDEAIDIDSTYSFPHYCKSFVHEVRGDTAKAISSLQKALKLEEDEEKIKKYETRKNKLEEVR
ncbi:MAG: tetratricopeptide repeat protein [Nanobdellota archaeon]